MIAGKWKENEPEQGFSFQAPWNESQDERFCDYLDSLPDVSDLEQEALASFHSKIRELICGLDTTEPKNEASEAYDLWADRHEELEDILDEILDRME